MPIRYIKVPDSITFKDPSTGEVIKNQKGDPETLSFETFLQKLMQNPSWSENYHQMKAQDEIMSAWEKCSSAKEAYMLLGEEEWQKLKTVTEFPKTEVMIAGMGMQIRPGFGYNPQFSRQLLPMAAAIMDAPATDPRVKPTS